LSKPNNYLLVIGHPRLVPQKNEFEMNGKIYVDKVFLKKFNIKFNPAKAIGDSNLPSYKRWVKIKKEIRVVVTLKTIKKEINQEYFVLISRPKPE
jgi:hypothetical protein